MPPWRLSFLLALYFVLLISSISVPLVNTFSGYYAPWLSHVTSMGITIALVGMVGVLLVPFLRLIDNASDTRNTVSAIYDDVHQLTSPGVIITSRQSLAALHATVDAHDAPIIFLGFSDVSVVRTIVNVLLSKQRGALYVSPRVLRTLLDVIDLGDATLQRMLYVTDCPRESCTVFGTDRNGEINCILFRYLPRRTISRTDEQWWSATLSPGTYAEYLYNTYDRHYRRGGATLLSSTLKACLLNEVNQTRVMQDRQLISDHLHISNSAVAYSYATRLLQHAQHSITAVDFMSPRLWIMPYGVMYDYAQAHLRSLTKIRIHVFKESRIAIDAAAYLEFIRINKDMHVDLRFINDEIARERGIEKGFLIIDDQMMFFSADEWQVTRAQKADVDSPRSIESQFTFDFRHDEVYSYKLLFEDLISMNERILLTPDAFASHINALTPHDEMT